MPGSDPVRMILWRPAGTRANGRSLWRLGRWRKSNRSVQPRAAGTRTCSPAHYSIARDPRRPSTRLPRTGETGALDACPPESWNHLPSRQDQRNGCANRRENGLPCGVHQHNSLVRASRGGSCAKQRTAASRLRSGTASHPPTICYTGEAHLTARHLFYPKSGAYGRRRRTRCSRRLCSKVRSLRRAPRLLFPARERRQRRKR